MQQQAFHHLRPQRNRVINWNTATTTRPRQHGTHPVWDVAPTLLCGELQHAAMGSTVLRIVGDAKHHRVLNVATDQVLERRRGQKNWRAPLVSPAMGHAHNPDALLSPYSCCALPFIASEKQRSVFVYLEPRLHAERASTRGATHRANACDGLPTGHVRLCGRGRRRAPPQHVKYSSHGSQTTTKSPGYENERACVCS